MKKTFREGITLIELSLSMVFVGILSVAVVLIISDTVASYRRGLTLAQVNTAGLDIVDDMRLAVSNSSAKAVTTECTRLYPNSKEMQDLCRADGAYNFVSVTKYSDNITVNGRDIGDNIPIYGAFCTGTYSYIWNSGYYEMKEASFPEKDGNNWAKLKYSATYGGKIKTITIAGSLRKNGDFSGIEKSESNTITMGWDARPFRLLKIRDNKRAVCVGAVRKADGNKFENNYDLRDGEPNSVFDISTYGTLDSEPEDLILADSENDLALFDLYVAKPAESSTQKNMFYAVSFILGTVSSGIDIMAKGQSCNTPTDYTVENFNYCAINKFNFAMQASGEL